MDYKWNKIGQLGQSLIHTLLANIIGGWPPANFLDILFLDSGVKQTSAGRTGKLAQKKFFFSWSSSDQMHSVLLKLNFEQTLSAYITSSYLE